MIYNTLLILVINRKWRAMVGDGTQVVTLDQVIAIVKQTSEDMKTHYKETAEGVQQLMLFTPAPKRVLSLTMYR